MNELINRIIHIYYLHIIHYIYLYIINIYKQEDHENHHHMNTKIFTWKPSNWGENHKSLTNFRFPLPRLKTS